MPSERCKKALQTFNPPASSEGIKWTLIGHSERRTKYGETDADVAEKALKNQHIGWYVICAVMVMQFELGYASIGFDRLPKLSKTCSFLIIHMTWFDSDSHPCRCFRRTWAGDSVMIHQQQHPRFFDSFVRNSHLVAISGCQVPRLWSQCDPVHR